MASICLRSNWTLGGVKDNYIKYEHTGDQFVGLTVSGLPIMDKEFSISVPYLDFNTFYSEPRRFIEGKMLIIGLIK